MDELVFEGSQPAEMTADFEEASLAYIISIYVVSSPHEADHTRITSSLSEAYRDWMQTPDSVLTVEFDWDLGDISGHAALKYQGPKTATISESYVGQTLRNMMVRLIALKVSERKSVSEYAGPVVVRA